MSESSVAPLAVEGYAVVMHKLDERGRLFDIFYVAVLHLLFDKDGDLCGATTMAGVHFGVPVIDPEGAIFDGKMIFPDRDAYVHWAKKHLQ